MLWLDENTLNGVQYAASASRVGWSNATELCQHDNATVAAVTSSEQDEFLRQHFVDTGTEYACS